MMLQHPLSAAFPSMSAAEFDELTADIKAHGVREPITIFDGMVLDGWHRFQACNRLGIKPPQFNFPEGKDPAAFVESANLHRRHLTGSQRAIAVVAVREWRSAGRHISKAEVASALKADGQKDARIPGGSPPSSKAEVASALEIEPATVRQMAQEAQVSEKTIRNAKAAARAGLSEAVRDGAMTVDEAAAVAHGKAKKAKRNTEPERPADIPDLTAEDELAEARDTLAEVARENEALRDRLAVESMDVTDGDRTAAFNTIKELRAQVVALQAELSAVKASRDSYMREAGEKQKQIDHMRREAKRTEKAAGVAA